MKDLMAKIIVKANKSVTRGGVSVQRLKGGERMKNAPILKDSEKKTKGKRAKETPEGETDVRAEGPQGESG